MFRKFFVLVGFPNDHGVDKEEGKTEEEDKSKDGEGLEPLADGLVFLGDEQVVEKSEKWGCQEGSNHGKTEHEGNTSLEVEDDDHTDELRAFLEEPSFLKRRRRDASFTRE